MLVLHRSSIFSASILSVLKNLNGALRLYLNRISNTYPESFGI